MSHATYNKKWHGAMEDLKELLQLEEDCARMPTTPTETLLYIPKITKLYVRYTTLANDVEDCQYNITQPQKREYARRLLEKLLIRVLQLKERVVQLNPNRDGSPHLYITDILTYLDVAPEQALLRLPRYLQDDPAVVDDWDVKQQKLQYWTKFFGGGQDIQPDNLKTPPHRAPSMSVDEAREIITRYERGRASIRRLRLLAAWRKRSAPMKPSVDKSGETQQHEAATRIQAVWRGYICRKVVKGDTRRTLLFYGADYVSESSDEDTLEFEKCLKTRKVFQKEAEKQFVTGVEADRLWLKENVASEMLRKGVEEGKDWMLEFRRRVGSLPQSLSDQSKDFQDIPPPPSDGKQYNVSAIAAGKKTSSNITKPVATNSRNNSKVDAKKKGTGSFGAAAPADEAEAPRQRTVVDDIQELTELFDRLWSRYTCDMQQEVCYDTALARQQLMPALETEVQEQTQQQLRQELSSLRAKLEGVKENDRKKKKGKKASHAGKKGKGKKKCCNNTVLSYAEPSENIYPDLVKDGIIKHIQPATLDEFVGSFPVVPPPVGPAAPEMLPAPTAWHLKQYLIENIMLPLASNYVRQNTPFPARSLLLYGPAGTGKSLLARIIASECRATFFDLSPAVIDNIYKQPKIGPALLLHKTFVAARQEAPAVIYIDKVHEVFMKKEAKKKKKRKNAGQAPSTAYRIKEQLKNHLQMVKKSGEPSEESERILIIGCTSTPFADRVDTKAMTDFFEHKLFVNCPDFDGRRMLWQHFLRKKNASFYTLDAAKLSILAEMAEGYAAGSLEKCVEDVFHERRRAMLATDPVEVNELGRSLYFRVPFCCPEEREKFANFDFAASGEKERVAQRKAKAAEAEKKTRK